MSLMSVGVFGGGGGLEIVRKYDVTISGPTPFRYVFPTAVNPDNCIVLTSAYVANSAAVDPTQILTAYSLSSTDISVSITGATSATSVNFVVIELKGFKSIQKGYSSGLTVNLAPVNKDKSIIIADGIVVVYRTSTSELVSSGAASYVFDGNILKLPYVATSGYITSARIACWNIIELV